MQNDFHPDYLELCALQASGSLEDKDESRLLAHLAGCPACRRALVEYEQIVSEVVPSLAPEPEQDSGTAESHSWSLDEAQDRLFARLHQEGSEEAPNQKWANHSSPRSETAVFWRNLWWQYAAGVLLLAGLGISLYKVALHRGADFAFQQFRAEAIHKNTNASYVRSGTRTESSAAQDSRDQRIAELQQRTEVQAREISNLRFLSASKQGQVATINVHLQQLVKERDSLAQQLVALQQRLTSLQDRLNVETASGQTAAISRASLISRVDELTAQVRDRDRALAETHDMLEHDRDIRDLMGSRELYIAEVYDVAKTGETEKPFGRVFYTKGKSLVFYAYDLDQQPGVKTASIFQAWGRRGPDKDRALSLGILYEDNTTSKRWVLKSHSAKSLAQIDAVFVTVEPSGGSPHPSTNPLLFAYLKVDPNHP